MTVLSPCVPGLVPGIWDSAYVLRGPVGRLHFLHPAPVVHIVALEDVGSEMPDVKHSSDTAEYEDDVKKTARIPQFGQSQLKLSSVLLLRVVLHKNISFRYETPEDSGRACRTSHTITAIDVELGP